MTTSESMWLELEGAARHAESGTQTVFRRLLPQCNIDLFAGVTCSEGNRFFQVLLPTGEPCPNLNEAPKMDGIELRSLIREESGGRASIELFLMQPSLSDIFTILVNDLADFLSERTDRAHPLEALVDRLCHWQCLLRSIGDGLGPERRRGLIGELWTLGQLIPIVGPDVALRSWCGPNGADQDFQLERVAIEVKTSTGSHSDAIAISSERQLDVPDGIALFLTCWHVDERLGDGGDSLQGAVTFLRSRLSSTASARFEVQLALSGYFERDAARYDQPRYAVRSETICRIVDGFPRILERDLAKGLGNVRYDISFEAMKPFVVASSAMESMLGVPGGGRTRP